MQVSVSSTVLLIDDSHNSGHLLFSGQKFNILINILEFLCTEIRQISGM